jgi:hypothetical protein
MPAKKQQDQPAAEVKEDHRPQNAAIGKQVLRVLGQPANLCRVQVWRLWEDHYRVNVLVGELATTRVAHSYFLVTDSGGNIVASTPAITRQY